MTQPCSHDRPESPEQTACCARRASSVASRRAVFGGVAAVASVPVLAACGAGDDSSGAGSSASATPSSEPTGGSDDTGDSEDTGEGGGSGGGIATSDIPVGGGTVYQDQELVVTQPTEGEFKAFSAVCTHSGCLVSEVGDDGIDCTCHGSVFSIEDGSPLDGPADEPLEEMTVTVEGDTLTVA